ncbi:MAG: serine hydrolase [Acidobacteria bacterium]|nr:MAG: serine hydrolase [Acidobacteriota bacterium]
MMKRSILFSLLVVLLVQLPVLAQADLKKLDACFAKALADWEVPGMAIAIVKDDAVVFQKGYGVCELGKPAKVDENTLFAIASNTKAFTAAALAILVDEGKVSWDDRVQDYLPYFQLYDPYVSHDFRIRDLLCHRSGIQTFGGDLIWYGTPYSREEVVRRARYLPQAFPFRSGYGYSNIMFIAAGEVVEKVTGQRWEQFIRDRFLSPLGMKRTVLSVKELAAKTNVATPHAELENKLSTFPWRDWANTVPAGGIISSVADLSHWLRLQLGRGTYGGKQFFSERQSRVMWTPHVSFVSSKRGEERNPNARLSGYGLGWQLSAYRGALLAHHGGAYDGMVSHTGIVPDKQIGVAVLTNSTTAIANALVYQVLDAYMGDSQTDWSAQELARSRENKKRTLAERALADSRRVADTKPSLPLQSYAGTYGGPMYGDAEIKVEDGRLVLAFLPNPELTGDLTHWHFDTFAVKWRTAFPWFGKGKVQFLLDDEGQVVEMKIDVPNEDFWFTELEFKKKR